MVGHATKELQLTKMVQLTLVTWTHKELVRLGLLQQQLLTAA